MDEFTLDALNAEALVSRDRAAENGPDEAEEPNGWENDDEAADDDRS